MKDGVRLEFRLALEPQLEVRPRSNWDIELRL